MSEIIELLKSKINQAHSTALIQSVMSKCGIAVFVIT